ncbi:hypothetical protein LAU42_08960 [Macrococcus armenti]|uniref:hypothetical protein n=1 Tax=Macrococcus armenti TaxID=2875764 RepID=UPI001CCDCDDF|nr:hypothetical protein [Macrococcus armenti]UBH21896.1 hypothetical protein LAU42_08960 [Macrococcus armenti]
MKMDKVAGSGNDEFYTPRYAIDPILKYVPNDATVWCPFDTEESNFVKMLKERGNTVVATHLQSGQDFFETYIDCDYIISNPPYSIKADVLDRLFTLDKPFAMLIGVVGLFESQRRFEMFRDNPFEIMYLNRRVAYFKDYADEKPSLNPPFSSVYLCSKVLPERIVFEEITKR